MTKLGTLPESSVKHDSSLTTVYVCSGQLYNYVCVQSCARSGSSPVSRCQGASCKFSRATDATIAEMFQTKRKLCAVSSLLTVYLIIIIIVIFYQDMAATKTGLS